MKGEGISDQGICAGCQELTKEVASLMAEFNAHCEWAGKSERLVALEKLMDERDVRYKQRSDQQDIAVERALESSKELAAVVAKATQEAVNKAEAAQKDVNVRGNEFRASLEDIGKRQIPRTEAEALVNSVSVKIDRLQEESRRERESQSREFVAKIEAVIATITPLQREMEQTQGRREQRTEGQKNTHWAVPVALSAISLFLGLGAVIISFLKM